MLRLRDGRTSLRRPTPSHSQPWRVGHPFVLCAAVLLGFLALTSPSAAQSGGTLRHPPVSGASGDVELSTVLLDNEVPIVGWSYGVCPDSTVAVIFNGVPGTDTNTINMGSPPQFQSIQFDSQAISHSVVISFVSFVSLPPGEGYEVLDIEYGLFGSTGSSGAVCFCENTNPPVSIEFELGGSSTLVPSHDCVGASIDPCPPVIPNRRADALEILPVPGIPGRFDLVLDWSLEAITPGTVLDTQVEFLVDGVVVASIPVFRTSGTATACCTQAACASGFPCPSWTDLTGFPFPATCSVSPTQGECACRRLEQTVVTDIDILPTETVVARLVPITGSEDEGITSDDLLSRRAPFFDRQLIRTAWLPDPANPGMLTVWAFVEVTAEEVDADVDFSYELTATVGGTAAGNTEIEVRIPEGVDPCVTQKCNTECMVPNSNGAGKCRKTICLICTHALEVPIGNLMAPPAGTPVEIELNAAAGALAESILGNDVFFENFVGPVAAPDRRLRPAAFVQNLGVSGPGTLDLDIAWTAETGGNLSTDLSARFQIFVNGTEVPTPFDSQSVIGEGGSCASAPCGSGSCGSWLVDGSSVAATCAFSPVQNTCACHVDLVDTVTFAAQPGDTVTVRVLAGPFGLNDIFPTDDSYTFTVNASSVPSFVRGNVNTAGAVDLGDAVTLLEGLFLGGDLLCKDAADVDDDGAMSIADAVNLLGFLFQGSAPPASPFPNCGVDTTADPLGCDTFPGCP